MAHEIVPTEFPQIKFAEDHSGVQHRAVLRTSFVEDDVLVLATRFSAVSRNRGATSAIIYLNVEDAAALRDFLNLWLRAQGNPTDQTL